jgi:hypothetical protein
MIKQPKITTIRISDTVVDRKYQRNTDRKRVLEIVKNFKPEGLGILYVSIRNDGKYYIIDGAHRVAALKQIGIETLKVFAYEGLTVNEEAYLYNLYDNQKPQSPSDKRKAGIIGKDRIYVFIEKLLSENGFAYGKRADKNDTIPIVKSDKSMVECHNLGEASFAIGIEVYCRVVGRDERMEGMIIRGFTMYFYNQEKYGSAREVQAIAEALKVFNTVTSIKNDMVINELPMTFNGVADWICLIMKM